MSPLLTIWTQPRQTTEYVQHSSPWLVVSLFASLAGLSTMLYLARGGAAFDKVDHALALGIIAVGGVLLGLVRVYLGALCVRWIARRLGGTGTYRATCVALAWGSLPETLALLVGLLAFALTGVGYLQAGHATSAEMAKLLLLTDKSIPFLGIWSVVATTNGLSQVQQISGARALFAFGLGVSTAVAAWLLFIVAVSSLSAV